MASLPPNDLISSPRCVRVIQPGCVAGHHDVVVVGAVDLRHENLA
jgi:hypothetical protein